MKLNAITGNGTRVKDFIDVYFILKQFSISEILHFYNTKYNNRNLLQVIKSLNYFDDIDNADWPEMIKETDLKLNQVTKKIKNAVITYSKSNFDIQ